MTTILKQFGTDYGEITLTERVEGLRYWVTLTLYGEQTDAPYFLSAKNKEHLRAYLTAHGKADRYEDFAVLPTTDKDDSDSFSNAHLVHETSIAAFFLPLEQACTNTLDWQLLMWEITSPRSAD